MSKASISGFEMRFQSFCFCTMQQVKQYNSVFPRSQCVLLFVANLLSVGSHLTINHSFYDATMISIPAQNGAEYDVNENERKH
mmetsp:Transcript_24498/g.36288  ORF Transcript_24498/g.36288 Transcript_24498/m.36288 type:complete len:83 (+) Transcript_24498:5135-5383(+)